MSDILEKIGDYKREEIAKAKRERPLSSLEADANAKPAPRGFIKALEAKLARNEYALIAEIKKASPSKGLIRADFDPPSHARAYEAGGAVCLSVLTLLVAAVLGWLQREEIAEARAWEADCILIIMAAVDDAVARDLLAAAHSYGMDALIEVHDAAELGRALKLDGKLIGINNRNLRTFETRLETTEELAPKIPRDKIIVGESGLFTPADLARLSRAGVNTFLIGESLMRQQNVEAATRAILAKTPARASA